MRQSSNEIRETGVYGPYGPDDESLPLVAIYARVSTEEQANEGHSIPTQIQRCIRKADDTFGKDGFRYRLYIDIGASGSLPALLPGSRGKRGRRGLGQLQADVESMLFDAVIVTHHDRIARSVRVSYEFLDFIVAKVKQAIIIDANMDLSTEVGRTMFGLMSVFAASERERIVERVRHGLTKRNQDGYWCGNPPYGWMREGKANIQPGVRPNIIKVEDEAVVMRQIYDWVLLGWGNWKIIQHLKEMGVRTKTGQDYWDNTTLTRNLRTPCHAGLIKVEGQLKQAGHFDQRIVEPAEYYQVQELLDRKKKIGSRTRSCKNHLLADIAKCGHCGSRLYLITSKEGKKYYRCFKRKPTDPSSCPGFMVNACKVEQALYAHITSLAQEPQLTDAAENEIAKVLENHRCSIESKLSVDKDQLAEIPAKRKELFSSLMNGNVSTGVIAHYEEQFTQLEKELINNISKLERELSELKLQTGRIGAAKKALREFPTVWGNLEIDEKRQLLSYLISDLRFTRDGADVIMHVELLLREPKQIKIPPHKRPDKIKNGLDSLTQRQLAILDMLSQGMPRRQIAAQMGIQQTAFNSHLYSIRKQLKVSSEEEMIEIALPRLEKERQFLPTQGRMRPITDKVAVLTELEIELLKNLSEGQSLCSLARTRKKALGTLSGQLKSAKKKLGVSTRQEAIGTAKDLKLIK